MDERFRGKGYKLCYVLWDYGVVYDLGDVRGFELNLNIKNRVWHFWGLEVFIVFIFCYENFNIWHIFVKIFL